LLGGVIRAWLRLVMSLSCNDNEPAARFSTRWPRLLVPGISNTLSAIANSHARAIWAGVAPWLAATRLTTGSVRMASCCAFGQPSGQNGTNGMPRAVHSSRTGDEARFARL